jgi:hypothetical protein
MKRAPLALALVLASAQAVLLARTAWDKSDTVDEPGYMSVGVHQWSKTLGGDADSAFDRNCESPALPKWGVALGLRIADPDLFAAWANRGTAKEPDPLGPPLEHARRNLFAARCATMLLTVAAGLLLWSAARAFGAGAALVTHALWCFSPTVLAQGSLATLDCWLADLCCFAIWVAFRLWGRPTLAWTAALGATLGLAAACKVPALGLLPVAAAVAGASLARGARQRGRGPAAALASGALALGAGFLLALWTVYGFSVGEIQTNDLCGLGGGLEGHTRFGPLPFPAWISGLLLQGLHGEGGHLSYLFGHIRSAGWWWFYLACLALKTTIGAQAAGLLRLAAWLKRPPRGRELLLDAAILAYPASLLLVMSLGRAQNGIRYIVPAFPFAMLWLGRGVGALSEAFGPRGLRALAACLALGTLESLAVHPHHLMFFNLWAGGPTGGPRYLVHGDDWGQDQRNLAEFLKSRGPWRLYYTFYNGNPGRWGLAWEQAPCQPTPGYYALHAVEVHRPKRMQAGCLDWLTLEPPDARIGYSIYFYQVTRARIERLDQERGKLTPFWQSATLASEDDGGEQ